jgi:hypothetical protein
MPEIKNTPYKVKPLNLFFVFLSLIIFVFLFRGFFNGDFNFSKSEQVEVPKEYLEILNQDSLENIKHLVSIREKSQNPISHFQYRNYNLVIYCLNIDSKNYKNVIKIKNKQESASTNVVYSNILKPQIEYLYNFSKVEKIDSINLYIKEDEIISKHYNDSILYLHFKLDEFSIKYDDNQKVIVHIKKGVFNSEEVYNSMMFLKRKEKLFVIYLVGREYFDLKEELLANLIFENDFFIKPPNQ